MQKKLSSFVLFFAAPSSLTNQNSKPEALHLSPSILIILLYPFQRQYWKTKRMSQELGNCDTWERNAGASMKVFIVVKHQPCLFVFSFCALLMPYSVWSIALNRWIQFVNVDFCQVSFCLLSPSKEKKHLWVAAVRIHTTKPQHIHEPPIDY